ncbi:MAG: carbohydrate porin [Lactobacillaceae bacterium]|jgi:hypothetical protein|nr:carbohydrate porin [Lactobacillaceae bacterium]
MNKNLLLGLSGILALGCANAAHADVYQDFKDDLGKKGIIYDGAATILGQRGAPSGKITPWQVQFYGEANWDMFKSDYGNGSLQVSYDKVRYWGRTADELDGNLGVASDINDYSDNARYFTQLSYTHQFVGKMDWLALTFGQFPMYLFDGNPYSSNQQTDFNNLALAQNASYSYPSASFGAFASLTPIKDWTAVVGFQDANNVDGDKIKMNTANDGDYTSFASLAYSPTIEGLGKSKYAILFYHQPSVDRQPKESYGWSVNISQDLGEKWAVFSRINGTTHSASLKQSYALGGVYKDPLNRNDLDRIGFAVAVNKPNREAYGHDVRNMETVFETYWDFGVGKYLLLTPDFQMYLKPALNRDTDIATVYSLRATLLF